MIWGKNLASSMTESHNTKEDSEGASYTKIIIKVRTPASWPPSSWYQDKKGHDDQCDESQKSKEDLHAEPQGDECHRRVINFYIGDYRPSKASTDEREAREGQRSEERRQRRLHIIRKHKPP